MSDNPLFKARQAELAKRGTPAKAVTEALIAHKEQELKTFKEEAKKAKKAAEQAAAEAPTDVEPTPEKEVFPPVLENKAIQPEEVKEETKEDEETL